MEAEEEQGWRSVDEHVCSCCVSDTALVAAVKEQEVPERECDFCGGVAAAPLEVLLERFVDGVRNEYGEADDEGVPWDGREGGYQVVPVLDTYDLVTDGFWHVLTGDGLVEAVRGAMIERNWAQKDWGWRRRDEVLTDAWDAFSETVKHKTRYVMWLQPRDDDAHADGEVAPAEILDEVGGLLRRLPGRLHRLGAGSTFWRARVHEDLEGEGCRSAQGLGTVPHERARQANRMSPAGLPLFYGARASDTAVRETTRRVVSGSVTYGCFETSRSCVVVDLTKLPDVSMFDPVWGKYWRYFQFLNKFAEALSRPVEPGDEHTEYVPTQIITEYLLRVFRDQHGHAVDGLLYNSSVTDGQCVVLDVPNGACVLKGTPVWDDRLELFLDENSLETRKLNEEAYS